MQQPNHARNHHCPVAYRQLQFDLLAVVSVISYRVWQPARLVVQPVELRHQAHSNGPSHSCVHYGHLHKDTHIILKTHYSGISYSSFKPQCQ